MKTRIEKNNPEISGKKQARRNEKGTFVKGFSGNPTGRPKGTFGLKTKLRDALLEARGLTGKDYQTALVEKLIHKAVVEGDMAAMRLVWEQMEGKPRTAEEIDRPLPSPIYGGLAR